MAIVCRTCEREVETLYGHRCEAEIGILLEIAPPAPEVEREEEIVARLATIAPDVKSWFLSVDSRGHRDEVVALLAEYLQRTRAPLSLDPTGSA